MNYFSYWTQTYEWMDNLKGVLWILVLWSEDQSWSLDLLITSSMTLATHLTTLNPRVFNCKVGK